MTKSILNDSRQKKLISGLSDRVTSLAGLTQATLESFHRKREEIESTFQIESKRVIEEQQKRIQQAITEWDLARESAYHSADRQTLNSIQKEQNRLKELTDSLRQESAKERKKHDDAQTEVKKKYEERKPKPEQSLEKIIQALRSKQLEVDEKLDNFRLLVLSRNLSIPSFSDAELTVARTTPTTTTSGWEFLQAAAARINELDQRVRKASIVRFSGSIAPWLVGIVPAVVIGWFLAKNVSAPFWLGPAIGLGIAILLPIIVIFATFPRVKSSMLGPYREMMQQNWLLRKTCDDVRILAEKNCRNEQARLLQDFQSRQLQLTNELQSHLEQLEKAYTSHRQTLLSEQSKLRQSAVIVLEQGLAEIDRQQAPLLRRLEDASRVAAHSHEEQFRETIIQLNQDQSHKIDRLSQRARRGTSVAEKIIREYQGKLAERFPDWNDPVWMSGNWSRDSMTTAFPIGVMSVELQEKPDTQDTSHVLEEHSKLEAHPETLAPISLKIPIQYDVLQHGTLTVLANRTDREAASLVIQNLLARGVTRLPMGSLHLTIIDPEGLGRDYGWLMPLADADPRLVTHRVWTQSNQISQQLSLIAYQNEEIIQQRLRDRYENLIEYNADAGPMAEPFRWIVWANFPFGLDEQSWKSLCSIFLSGPRCGIGVLLTIDPQQAWPVFADKQKVMEKGVVIELRKNAASDPTASGYLTDQARSSFPIDLELPPTQDRLGTIIETCKESALNAGKIEVPFAQIATTASTTSTNQSSEGLVIPLGIAGVGRTQSMRLGQGTAQHVLVAGKTGSGKSSLLHTLITSAALQYGPEELRFVLMDFKKGVEFQVYAHSALPHADIIGIESKREFGLSALEYLDRVMSTRGEMFRDAGVQDVPSWCRTKPNEAMPRVLVVIDEFQEMFVEDDKLAQKSAMLLDRIVRQGRSFGIHMVMASQTLGGSYSLPRTTLAQMAVRVALQCDGADAMLILGEDNMAASRLRHSGQAIYNDAGGRVESNQPFQVAYLTSSSHSATLESISLKEKDKASPKRLPDPSTNFLGRQIVFEGHRPAIWNAFDVNRGWDGAQVQDPQATMLVLGESLSIEPTIVKSLTRQSGRNIALVGSDDAIIANLISSVWRGWSERISIDQTPFVCFLDGSRPEDRFVSELKPKFDLFFKPQILDSQSESSLLGIDSNCFADSRNFEPLLQLLCKELDRRVAHPEKIYRSVCFFVLNLSRFRELKRNEEFSFGASDTTSAPTPEANFTRLLREGPANGIHSIVCSDSAGNLSRWISRQGMRDLEIRILSQMSNNDSNTLIDSGAANRLEPHALIYYDEIDGKVIKIRPYQSA